MRYRAIFSSLVCLFIFLLVCFGESYDSYELLDGLTDLQKAKIVLQCEDMKSKLKAKHEENWSNIGKKIVMAIKSASKEYETSIDEFSKTLIGKITILTVSWSVIGKTATIVTSNIIDIVVLFPILITWICMWFYIYQRYFIIKSIYLHGTDKEGITYKKLIEYQNSINDNDFVDSFVFRLIFFIVFLVVCILILVIMIA